jgi:hypothetical protein
MKNFLIEFKKCHGQFDNLMDNVVHKTTTPSIGGQLSVDNRFPLTIVHESYKIYDFLYFMAFFAKRFRSKTLN